MNHAFPYSRFESHLYRIYRLFLFKPFLKKLGKQAFISPYAKLQHMELVSIGNRVYIGSSTLIQPIIQYLAETFTPSISIQDDVYIGNRCTISASAEITIGEGVTIGDLVYIGGGRHGYEDPNNSVLKQNIVVGSIKIGPRAWIGYGSFIASTGNLEIGEHAIVAANSVVTKSVPAFTIVAGTPAKPIKYYDFPQGKWVSVVNPTTV
jgi:acetyltransferase-like isoleucine patch superfamily enzyme